MRRHWSVQGLSFSQKHCAFAAVLYSVVALLETAATETPSRADTPKTQEDLQRLREAALSEARRSEESKTDPRLAEAARKLREARSALYRQTQTNRIEVQAEVISVDNGAVLASIRVRKKGKLSSPLKQPVWIEGVDTKFVVDGAEIDLTLYLAGTISYQSTSGANKTVYHYATDPWRAVELLMASIEKK